MVRVQGRGAPEGRAAVTVVRLGPSAESWGPGKVRSWRRVKRASPSWSLAFSETNSPRSKLMDSVPTPLHLAMIPLQSRTA